MTEITNNRPYNIMAVNPGHNGSMAFLSDGKLLLYVEEERLSRQKYDGNPFRGMLQVLGEHHVDELVIGGTSSEMHALPWTQEDSYTALVRKFNPKILVTKLGHEHHLGHAAQAYYNSGFEGQTIVIVIDGAGSYHKINLNPDEKEKEKNPIIGEGYECESVYLVDKNGQFQTIFKSYGNNKGGIMTNGHFFFDDAVTITKAYEGVSHYLGFGFIEAGKTMGLAPYGEHDDKIPALFESGRGNKNMFVPSYPAGSIIDQARIQYLKQEDDPRAWHHDPSKLTKQAKNLAWAIQQWTQNLSLQLIQHAVKQLNVKKVAVAGGFFLNCVANYYYKQRLNRDIQLYVDPVAHDGGTSIGLAKLAWAIHTNRKGKQEPLTTLYLGKNYNITEHDLEKYDDIQVKDITTPEVAKMIADRNIVAMYQGCAEAGPRALGNRSILYDPSDPDGKDTVNKVKGREWFRPFAGSCLHEHANEWFDLQDMEESPFMMYAVDVLPEKQSKIPCITHVDNTCRVQTVKHEQNPHYYDLISEFHKITNIPVLFNTSFNLAGDPLVETLDDAIYTLRNSELNYLYLPEIGKLVICDVNYSAKESEPIDLGEKEKAKA
jgi:carbamoyltransferase